MTKKLFVGGLSWGTGDDQLKAAFGTFGTVADAKVILDIDTGRSRGFGFVTFADDDAATKAIAEMDGKELDGRVIRVNEAQDKPRGPRPARDSSGGPARSYSGSPRSGAGGGFRNDARPPAKGQGKRRGRAPEGRGEDRFDRKRNTQTRRGSRDSNDYGGDAYGDDDV